MTRIAICFMFAVAALGCKKENITKTIDPEIKQHFSFQPGTYWIYKDSVTGKEDSFYVSQNITGTETGDIEYNESLITIHNDTAVGSCSFHLSQTVMRFTLAKPYTGFGMSKNKWSTILTFSVGGNTFDSVAKVNIEGAYYVRHNVGIVKIAAEKGSFHKVWELQRYHIVK